MKIGFSIEAVKGERWQTDLDEFQQRAHELGGAVVTRSADGDGDLQLRQIKDLLALYDVAVAEMLPAEAIGIRRDDIEGQPPEVLSIGGGPPRVCCLPRWALHLPLHLSTE